MGSIYGPSNVPKNPNQIQLLTFFCVTLIVSNKWSVSHQIWFHRRRHSPNQKSSSSFVSFTQLFPIFFFFFASALLIHFVLQSSSMNSCKFLSLCCLSWNAIVPALVFSFKPGFFFFFLVKLILNHFVFFSWILVLIWVWTRRVLLQCDSCIEKNEKWAWLYDLALEFVDDAFKACSFIMLIVPLLVSRL